MYLLLANNELQSYKTNNNVCVSLKSNLLGTYLDNMGSRKPRRRKYGATLDDVITKAVYAMSSCASVCPNSGSRPDDGGKR